MDNLVIGNLNFGLRQKSSVALKKYIRNQMQCLDSFSLNILEVEKIKGSIIMGFLFPVCLALTFVIMNSVEGVSNFYV